MSVCSTSTGVTSGSYSTGLLEGVPLAVTQRLWFQHDVAPAYHEEDVRQWLDDIQEGGLDIESRLHGLFGHLICFLWGHLKEYVYVVPPKLLKISWQDFNQL
jgi:hypothetical protein